MSANNIFNLSSGFSAVYPPRLQVLSAFIQNQQNLHNDIHLRWLTPKSFPSPTRTQIYSFTDDQWGDHLANLDNAAPKTLTSSTILPAINSLTSHTGEHLLCEFESAGILLVVGASKSTLKPTCVIRFKKPATIAIINFKSSAIRKASVFHRGYHLFNQETGDQDITLEGPGFTDILIDLEPSEINNIKWYPEEEIFNEKFLGSPIAEIQPPQDANQAYALIPLGVNSKLKNYYVDVDTLDQFKEKYDPKHVESLIDKLNTPDKIHAVAAKNGISSTEIITDSVLNLAQLDPNIACLSGMYFIDIDKEATNDLRYLFVSEIKDENSSSTYNIFGYTRSTFHRPKPSFESSLTAEQVSGISYIDRIPHGRVGIFSSTTVQNKNITLVDVERVEDNGTTTSLGACLYKPSRPIRSTDESISTPFFIDEQVPVQSKVSYRLRPVDIFGRTGEPFEITVGVKDLNAPVPPSSLNIQLTQNGFPWTDPTVLRNNNLNTGTLVGSFCYEEGQWTQSPDAVKAHIYYFLGSKDQRPEVSEWESLKSIDLSPPKDTLAHIQPEYSVSKISLIVAEVKYVDENINPTIHSDNPKDNLELSVKPEHVELLLDRALLEPNLFKGYKCELDGQAVDVLSSTAGLAFSDDKANCARIIVKGVSTSTLPTVVSLFLPPIRNLTTASLESAINAHALQAFDHVSLIADICIEETDPSNLSSGSVALDLRYYLNTDATTESTTWIANNGSGGHQQTLVTQIVGEAIKVASPNNLLRTLVRVRPLDYLKLLLSEREKAGNRVARVYPTYSFGPLTFGIHSNTSSAPSGIDIAVNIPEEARYQTASFAIRTEDKLGMLGAPTTPFEARVIQPPPAPPPPPFPRKENGQGASERIGYAGIPSRRRESRIALDWEQKNELLRYDISRALDTSIIALHKSLWMAGKTDISTSSVELTITEHSTLDNGMLKIVVLPDPQVPLESFVSSLKAFSGGRITVKYQQDNLVVDFHHRLVDVKRYTYKESGANVTIIYCLCKPNAELGLLTNADISKTVTVSSLPDFNAVLNDDDRLRELADEPSLDSAFGLVNTVPLTFEQSKNFDDLIPSPASNRYFYRVRAIAKSGSASAWSKASIPFYGFPAFPEPLSSAILQHIKDDNWLLTWERPLDYINEVELNIIDLDGQATLAAKISADFQNESRFVNSHYLLFDTPIDIASDSIDELENWKVYLDDSTNELLGEFIYREEAIDKTEQVLRITGFRANEALPLAQEAIIKDANNVEQQIITLTIPNRQAAIITLNSSLSGVSFKACAIVKYNDITLRSEESNVDSPTPEPLQNIELQPMGDQWLLTWDRSSSKIDKIELYMTEDDGEQILLAAVGPDDFIVASRFAAEKRLMFDNVISLPISSSTSSTGGVDEWQVFLDDTDIPLEGVFLRRPSPVNHYNLAGFEVDGFIPVAKNVTLRGGNNRIIDTFNLKNTDRQALTFSTGHSILNREIEIHTVLHKLHSTTKVKTNA